MTKDIECRSDTMEGENSLLCPVAAKTRKNDSVGGSVEKYQNDSVACREAPRAKTSSKSTWFIVSSEKRKFGG